MSGTGECCSAAHLAVDIATDGHRRRDALHIALLDLHSQVGSAPSPAAQMDGVGEMEGVGMRTKISRALMHRALTSDSLMYSHCHSCSIILSMLEWSIPAPVVGAGRRRGGRRGAAFGGAR